jgi:hypothetical protein
VLAVSPRGEHHVPTIGREYATAGVEGATRQWGQPRLSQLAGDTTALTYCIAIPWR